MPQIYAPKKMTVTTLSGHGVSLKQGETRDVNAEVFAVAIQQGAYPVMAGAVMSPELKKAPVPDAIEPAPSADGPVGFTVVGEDDEDAEETRYPEGATVDPVAKAVTDDDIKAALRKIALRADQKQLGVNGMPKATVLSKELGGFTVDAEKREALWAEVVKEL